MIKQREAIAMTQKIISKDGERILMHYIGVLIACADECDKIVPETTPKM
jgi:uncharacterized protein (DUF169 family)